MLTIEQAEIDFSRSKNLLSKVIETDENSYVTTTEELQNLAKNTQNDVDKVIKINSIASYYINKDDLIGKVVETIENNINTSYKLSFPNIPAHDKGLRKQVEDVIRKFHKDIDIEKLIIENCINTYVNGNYMTYLRGDIKKGYAIESYPLGVYEISKYKIGNEPILLLELTKLKSNLQKNNARYTNLKANKLVKVYKKVEDEIKAMYPKEVGEAVKKKDSICFLDPTRTGISRINNLRGLYGVTPIFKALPSMLMVETFDKVDRVNAISRSKKIYHQILRKELLGQDGSKTKHASEISYAHATFLQALGQSTVVVTTPGYVEEIKVIEPKLTETNPNTILGYRNRVLNALGISFLSNESKSSFNAVSVAVDELLKTINKISKQLEHTLNKYYKNVLDDVNIDMIYAPEITINDTRMIDLESRMKLVDLLYSKLGMSYKTVLDTLDVGLDLETEVMNRLSENDYEIGGEVKNLSNEIFMPHSNSYTANSNDLMTNNGSSDVESDTKTVDMDKKIANEESYESKI